MDAIEQIWGRVRYSRGFELALALLGGVVLALCAALPPGLTVDGSAVIVTSVAIVVFRDKLASIYGSVMLVVLTGYMFFGKGFAYCTVGPLYVGEVALVIGVVALVLGPRQPHRKTTSAVLIFLTAFCVWGVVRTVPYLESAGMFAVRDSAIYYYGIFTVLVASLVTTRERIERAFKWFAALLPWFLVWVPFLQVIDSKALSPLHSASQVPMIVFKAGDTAIFVGLAIALLLTVPDRFQRPRFTPPVPALWVFAIMDVLIVSAKNRGGMLAIAFGIALVLMLRPSSRILTGAAMGTAMFCVFAASAIEISVQGRVLSIDGLQTNISSIFGGKGGERSGTITWRLQFWGDIVDDTIHGPMFWEGRGFGLNLADHYGYQVFEDGTLRSPHNATMTILARSGVIGLSLWVVMNLTYAISLLVMSIKTRAHPDALWQFAPVMLLAHWAMINIDGSFDPYLEGPQGGIWFWSSIGFGIVVLSLYARESRTASRQVRPQALNLELPGKVTGSL